MGVAENPGKLGPQLPGAALMAMILPEAGVHPGNVSLDIAWRQIVSAQARKAAGAGMSQSPIRLGNRRTC